MTAIQDGSYTEQGHKSKTAEAIGSRPNKHFRNTKQSIETIKYGVGDIAQRNSIYETSVSQGEDDELKNILKNHARQMITFKNINQGTRVRARDRNGCIMKPLIDKNSEWNATDAKKVKQFSRERPLLFTGVP